MTDTPRDEEPGFETDVNELPEDWAGSETTLEDDPLPEDADMPDLDEAQQQAAEERREGGYQ